MQRGTSEATFLRLSVLNTPGALPATASLCLAAGQTAVVGRMRERCQLPVADRWLAPVHFEIQASDSGFVIRDLSADTSKHAACEQRCFMSELRNQTCPEAFCTAAGRGNKGLYVNGNVVREAAIHDADVLSAGMTSFRVQLSQQPPSAAAPVASERPSRGLQPEQRAKLLAQLTQAPLYAVLDAARGPCARSLLFQHEDLSYSLYDGPGADPLAEVAPYLVSLAPDSKLLEHWLSDHWGESYGYFILSDAPFKLLRRHLRKFLKVQDSQQRTMHFRFYDPRVIRGFLPTCSPAEVTELFGPISRMVVESAEALAPLSFSADPSGLRREVLRIDGVTP